MSEVYSKLDTIMAELEEMMERVDGMKSGNRTESDRRLAVLRTELEKVIAFALYVQVNHDSE